MNVRAALVINLIELRIESTLYNGFAVPQIYIAVRSGPTERRLSVGDKLFLTPRVTLPVPDSKNKHADYEHGNGRYT